MTSMRKIEKPSPTESPLLFELDPQAAEEFCNNKRENKPLAAIFESVAR
jgi:hypothetical protein